ncbi:MAG: transcriptional repressor [bacterium]
MAARRPLPTRRRPSDEVDWKHVGLRRTPQREVVLDLVRSCDDHPTAEWIYRHARQALSDISLATIYRTLRILKEKGLIWEFSGGANPSRFDGTSHVHEHLRCISCGLVADIDLEDVRDLRREVSEQTGWTLGRWPVVFHGLCQPCATRRAAVRQAAEERNPGGAAPNSGPEDDRDLCGGFW